MYLHFEGLDLAGKSTLCKRLKEKWPVEQTRHNSISDGNILYEKANELRKKDSLDSELLGWLYYAAMILDLEKFSKSEGRIIQDSTILLRSLAFHLGHKTPVLPEFLIKALDKHPRFDYSFVLVASRECRLKRLEKRRENQLGPEDFIVRDNPDLFYKMESILVDYSIKYFNAKVIDTSDLEYPDKSDSIIESIIKVVGV